MKNLWEIQKKVFKNFVNFKVLMQRKMQQDKLKLQSIKICFKMFTIVITVHIQMNKVSNQVCWMMMDI